MRISDWSSDVCSSDLLRAVENPDRNVAQRFRDGRIGIGITRDLGNVQRALVADLPDRAADRHQRGEAFRLCQRQFPGAVAATRHAGEVGRSEEHTSELQTLMRNSYAVFCLKKKKKI